MNSGLRIGARLWWGVPVLLVLLWTAGAFAVEVFPGLASTPLVTVWLIPVAHFTRDIAAAITVGAIVIGLILPGPVSGVLPTAKYFGGRLPGH